LKQEIFILQKETMGFMREKIASLEPKPKRQAPTPLTDDEIARIHELAAEGNSGAEIARIVDRSAGTVSFVLRGAKGGHHDN